MKIQLQQPTTVTTEQLVKRLFYILWQHSSCAGYGFLQDRGEQQEDVVWDNIMGAKDYAFDTNTKPFNAPQEHRPCADYVFGRMMKFGLEYNNKEITITREVFTSDYQSWSTKISLVDAIDKAAIGLGVKISVIK